ncbi:hypothetical protein DV738_g2263, partial [Chaetothyriales sp. CBS 135597]
MSNRKDVVDTSREAPADICLSAIMPSGGSHPKYDQRMRYLIALYLEAGFRNTDIANTLGVSKSFVSTIKSNVSQYNNPSPPIGGIQGAPRKVSAAAEEGIVDFLREHPAAPTRDEVAQFLRDEYNIDISVTTVGRLLQRLKDTNRLA